MQSKYINDQMSRPLETRTLVEQRVVPNYQSKTVSYGPPQSSSMRSSNLEGFKKRPYEAFENIVSHHAKPRAAGRGTLDVVGKKIAKKRTAGEGEAKTGKKPGSPNTIEFSNQNGPETFTITHKT